MLPDRFPQRPFRVTFLKLSDVYLLSVGCSNRILDRISFACRGRPVCLPRLDNRVSGADTQVRPLPGSSLIRELPVISVHIATRYHRRQPPSRSSY